MQQFKYKAFIFDLDNTIYPEKDYLYQIYFLIGKYLEEKEQKNAKDITDFLILHFDMVGRENLLDKMMEKFEVRKDLMDNLLQIMRTAKLPLKLLMYQKVYDLLNALKDEKALLFILTNGNPEQQLNKVKHVDWYGLEKELILYLANEYKPKPAPDAVYAILDKYQLQKEDVLLIGDSKEDEYCAKTAGIAFFPIQDIIGKQASQ